MQVYPLLIGLERCFKTAVNLLFSASLIQYGYVNISFEIDTGVDEKQDSI